MIVVTHDFGVAARLCDRVAVMKDGEIIEEGKTQEVFSAPNHEYTRRLRAGKRTLSGGTMLKAEHVTKQYQVSGGGHTMFDAVSDVSMELKDGCVTAIVGESGSGKSTFARVLSYVERPDSGRVFLDSLEVTACGRKDLRTVRGKVQLVMQNALGSLDPHQSVAASWRSPCGCCSIWGRRSENSGALNCWTWPGWSGTHSAVGRMNSPVDSKNGCVLPVLWLPSPNTLSLTSPSADWMSH